MYAWIKSHYNGLRKLNSCLRWIFPNYDSLSSIEEYISYYNEKRRHSSLGNRTPKEVYLRGIKWKMMQHREEVSVRNSALWMN